MTDFFDRTYQDGVFVARADMAVWGTEMAVLNSALHNSDPKTRSCSFSLGYRATVNIATGK